MISLHRSHPAVVLFVGLLVVLLVPCAVRAQDTLSTSERPAPRGRWSGTFREVQVTTLRRGGMPARYTGTAEIQASSRGRVGVSRFEIRVSSGKEIDQLDWGLSLGRCGSRLILQTTTNQLPPIQLRGGGVGELIQEVPMELDAKASYQVVLFIGGHEQQNIAACANLRYDARGR